MSEKSGIKLMDVFTYKGQKYLDQRSEVDTFENISAVGTVPEGFIVYVKTTKKYYKYLSGRWVDLGGRESASDIRVIDDISAGEQPTDAAVSARVGKSINTSYTEAMRVADTKATAAQQTTVSSESSTLSQSATGLESKVTKMMDDFGTLQTTTSQATDITSEANSILSSQVNGTLEHAQNYNQTTEGHKNTIDSKSASIGTASQAVTTSVNSINTTSNAIDTGIDTIMTGGVDGVIDNMKDIEAFLKGQGTTASGLKKQLDAIDTHYMGELDKYQNPGDIYVKKDVLTGVTYESVFLTKKKEEGCTDLPGEAEKYLDNSTMSSYQTTSTGRADAVSNTCTSQRPDIEALLNEKFPISVSLSTNGVSVLRKDIGTGELNKKSISLSYTVTYRGETVTTNSGVKVTLTTKGLRHDITEVISGGTKSLVLSNEFPGYIKFTINVEYNPGKGGIRRGSASQSILVTYPTLYKSVPADTQPYQSIDMRGAAEYLWASPNGTVSPINLENQKVCIAYPAEYGTLSSIRDGNNFENLTAFSSWTEDAPGHYPVLYRYYLMNTPIKITGGSLRLYPDGPKVTGTITSIDTRNISFAYNGLSVQNTVTVTKEGNGKLFVSPLERFNWEVIGNTVKFTAKGQNMGNFNWTEQAYILIDGGRKTGPISLTQMPYTPPLENFKIQYNFNNVKVGLNQIEMKFTHDGRTAIFTIPTKEGETEYSLGTHIINPEDIIAFGNIDNAVKDQLNPAISKLFIQFDPPYPNIDVTNGASYKFTQKYDSTEYAGYLNLTLNHK